MSRMDCRNIPSPGLALVEYSTEFFRNKMRHSVRQLGVLSLRTFELSGGEASTHVTRWVSAPLLGVTITAGCILAEIVLWPQLS